MMAALLRQGARRLSGSMVQRTRAAFTTPAASEEQRLLSMEHLKPRHTTDLPDVMLLIQERKEELYDLVSSMEGTSERNNYQNRQLLKFLSKQVKPRPDDSLWRRMRTSERMKDAARAAVFVSGLTLAYKVFFSMADGMLEIQNAKKQEQLTRT